MKLETCLLATFATISLFAGNLSAQTAERARATERAIASEGWNPDAWTTVDKLVGCDVSLSPSAEQLREAAEDGDQPDRGQGEIKDLLIEPRSGQIEWAVVSCGGLLGIGDHTVAVPASALRWNAAEQRLELGLSQDELEQAPEFDLGEARERGLSARVEVVEAAWSREVREPAQERGGEQDVLVFDTLRLRRTPERVAVASELDEYPVFAQSQEFGDLKTAIVDVENMRVAFAVVARGGLAGIGGQEYLLPYESLLVCQRVDGDEHVLCVDRPTVELERAVKYERPEHGVLDRESAARARAGM